MNASLDFLKDMVGSAESAKIVFYVADEATRSAVVGSNPEAVIHDGGIQIAITQMSQRKCLALGLITLAACAERTTFWSPAASLCTFPQSHAHCLTALYMIFWP